MTQAFVDWWNEYPEWERYRHTLGMRMPEWDEGLSPGGLVLGDSSTSPLLDRSVA